MDTKIIAIICVVIVVAAGAGGAVLLMNGNSNSGSGDKYTVGTDVEADPLYENFDVENVECLMFGNANNDGYLNSDDLTLLNKFIAGTETWSIDTYPLADTNADGEITQADADLLSKILEATSSTEQFEVKYLNYYKRVATSLYPLKGGITVQYNTGYDICVILGVLDQVVGTGHGGEKHINSLSETMYPGLKSHLTYIDNDAGDFDPEKILATNTKIVLGDPYGTTDDFASEMAKLDPTCTVLNLPINRVLNGIDYTQTVITMGALMNIQSQTAAYVEYVKQIKDTIADAVETAKLSSKTYLIAFNPSSANTIGLDVMNTMDMQYTDVMNMAKLPVTIALPPVTRYYGGMYNNLEAEYIATVNPEFIVLESYGIAGANVSESDYVTKIQTIVDYFDVTNAYQNDKIIIVPFEVIGGVAGLSTLCLIGHYMWGETAFPEATAKELINYYYQNFTHLGDGGATVDMFETYGYAPEIYGATKTVQAYVDSL